MEPPRITSATTPEGNTVLRLEGAWHVPALAEMERAVTSVTVPANRAITVNASAIKAFDTSAAWLLVSFLRGLEKQGREIALEGFSPEHARILEIIDHIEHPDSIPPRPHGVIGDFFYHLGRDAFFFLHETLGLIGFFGRLSVTFLRTLLDPRRLRLRSVVYHVNEVGIRAMPIVALMAFLISIVMGYQGAHQLEKFGARIFTVDLVTISLLREMGVIITAILVAGRSGSAFAAQIGVMQVNEEVDAMRAMGLDPFELLVLPRVLGILIALPALTFLADMVGLFGALFMSAFLLDISTLQFLERVRLAAGDTTLWIGLVKAPVFAVLIGMVGCLQGMQVKGSAAEVGERTTAAVVQGIFLVTLFDAAFSILFTWMGV